MRFWVPWTIDATIAAIGVFFFFVGLVDGSVSSFNMGLWMCLLLGLALVVGGSLWLRARKRVGAATWLLWILAGPGICAALFFVLLLVSSPRWN
jgi:drug/metabolite transporter (DMT)-like permease